MTVDGDPAVISEDFEIDIGPIISILRYGEYTEITDDPCHRQFLETLIENIQRVYTSRCAFGLGFFTLSLLSSS
jgi:hypothetical protein